MALHLYSFTLIASFLLIPNFVVAQKVDEAPTGIKDDTLPLKKYGGDKVSAEKGPTNFVITVAEAEVTQDNPIKRPWGIETITREDLETVAVKFESDVNAVKIKRNKEKSSCAHVVGKLPSPSPDDGDKNIHFKLDVFVGDLKGTQIPATASHGAGQFNLKEIYAIGKGKSKVTVNSMGGLIVMVDYPTSADGCKESEGEPEPPEGSIRPGIFTNVVWRTNLGLSHEDATVVIKNPFRFPETLPVLDASVYFPAQTYVPTPKAETDILRATVMWDMPSQEYWSNEEIPANQRGLIKEVNDRFSTYVRHATGKDRTLVTTTHKIRWSHVTKVALHDPVSSIHSVGGAPTAEVLATTSREHHVGAAPAAVVHMASLVDAKKNGSGKGEDTFKKADALPAGWTTADKDKV